MLSSEQKIRIIQWSGMEIDFVQFNDLDILMELMDKSKQYKICKSTTSLGHESYDIWVRRTDNSDLDVYSYGLSLKETLQRVVAALATESERFAK
jgi:hypothetical protein